MAVYGLIGEKLSHSFSKPIHEQLTGEPYELFPLSREEFPVFMERREFDGINVTIPYKQDVIPYCTAIDERAQRIGAVNTIVCRNGELTGYNTDYDGFSLLLAENHLPVRGATALVLGSGGTSKTVRTVLADQGAKEVLIVSRSPVSGEISYEDALSRKDVTFLVNTTPVGMYPHTDRQPIDLAEFPALEGVADVVYNPLRTRLLQQAEDLKLPCANGLLMLAAQAKYAAERFRDCRIPEEKTLEVLRTLENDKCNVALTGMPMCGKSTLGRRLSELLHKKFVDVDEEIEKEASMTVPQIFERFGEAGFRELESRVVAALSQQNGLVISTGGGTVLAPGNIRNLRLNSILLFIDRPLSRLTVGKGRPLAKSPREIEALYQMRYPIYRANCHCRIENNSDPDTALSLAVKAYQDFLSGTFREFGSNR